MVAAAAGRIEIFAGINDSTASRTASTAVNSRFRRPSADVLASSESEAGGGMTARCTSLYSFVTTVPCCGAAPGRPTGPPLSTRGAAPQDGAAVYGGDTDQPNGC